MVRLMLVLAPVMCILSAIGISSMLAVYMKVSVMIDVHVVACYTLLYMYYVKSKFNF